MALDRQTRGEVFRLVDATRRELTELELTIQDEDAVEDIRKHFIALNRKLKTMRKVTGI